MVKNIVIVGGGSAGWLTAAHLSTRLEGIGITLIESSDIPIIGVGESTIVPIVNFMKSLNLAEADWMPYCDATYKSAIRFENFHSTDDPAFWYSFEPMDNIEGRPLSRYWYHKHLNDPAFADRFTFYDYCFVTPEACRQRKTVRSITREGPAYHLDAGLLGEFLRKRSEKNGVERIIDSVRGANRNEDGTIRSLARANGPDLEADLFIDCTGFRSQLMGGVMEEPFDHYFDYLFNNKAVAIRYPYQDRESEMYSYTNCTAVSSGWIWQIPLWGRVGAGYVYCDRYQSADEAERELKQFLGYERTRDLEARHIDIRVGKHRRTWVKNCVAVGLASGFIEPLESTGLFIIQHQAETLGYILAGGRNDYNAADVAVYNGIQTELYEGIRDFLVTHYALTRREDTPYWKDVKYGTKIPDSLARILRLSRMTIPDLPVIRQFYPPNFGDYSFTDGWQCILIGMNHLPFGFNQFQNVGPYEEVVVKNLPKADRRHSGQEDYKRREIPGFPSHYRYLKDTIHTG